MPRSRYHRFRHTLLKSKIWTARERFSIPISLGFMNLDNLSWMKLFLLYGVTIRHCLVSMLFTVLLVWFPVLSGALLRHCCKLPPILLYYYSRSLAREKKKERKYYFLWAGIPGSYKSLMFLWLQSTQRRNSRSLRQRLQNEETAIVQTCLRFTHILVIHFTHRYCTSDAAPDLRNQVFNW